MTIAMFVEDHWCFAPIISYGLVEPPADYLEGFAKSFFLADKECRPTRPRGDASTGWRVPRDGDRPSNEADFEPDVVMIYCTPGQLRHLLISLRICTTPR